MSKPKLWHIYWYGRFGPERLIGFVIARGHACINARTGIGVDAVNSTEIDPTFYTNPLSIGDIHGYSKWRRRNKE